ncbi:MAG TPA: hypothetical protein VF292_02880 [Rhodanobacteraceae bacterium]
MSARPQESHRVRHAHRRRTNAEHPTAYQRAHAQRQPGPPNEHYCRRAEFDPWAGPSHPRTGEGSQFPYTHGDIERVRARLGAEYACCATLYNERRFALNAMGATLRADGCVAWQSPAGTLRVFKDAIDAMRVLFGG